MILQQLGSELLAAIMATLHRLLAFFLANDADILVATPVIIIFSTMAYIWVYSKDEEESEAGEFDQLDDYLFAEQAHYFWIGFHLLLLGFFSLVISIKYGDASSKWASELERENVFVAAIPVVFVCCSFYAFIADLDLLSSWYTSDSAYVSKSDDVTAPACVTKNFMDQLLDIYTEMKGYEADSVILIRYLEDKLEQYETLGHVTSDGCLVSLEEYKRFADNEHYETVETVKATYESYVTILETEIKTLKVIIEGLVEEATREKGSLMEELWLSAQRESIGRPSIWPFSDGLFSARGKGCEEVKTAPQELSQHVEHEEASVQESAAHQHVSDQVTLRILEASGPANPIPFLSDRLVEQWEEYFVPWTATFALPEIELGEEAALADPEQDGMRTSTTEGSSESDDEGYEDEEDEDRSDGGANDARDDDDDDDEDDSTGGTGSIVSQLPKDSAEDDRSYRGGSSGNETSHSSQSEEVNSSIETEFDGDVESDDTELITNDNKPDPRFYSKWQQKKEDIGDFVGRDPSDSSTAAEAENADGSQKSGSEDDEIEGDGEDSPGDHVGTDLLDSSTTAEAENADGSQASGSEEDEIEGEGVLDGEFEGEPQGQRKRTRRAGKKRKNPVKRKQAREAQEEHWAKQSQREQGAQQAQQEEREGDQSVRQAEEAQKLVTRTSTVIEKLPAGIYPSPERPEDEQSTQHQQPRQELQEIGQSVQRADAAQNLFPRPPGPPRVSLPPNPPRRSLPGLGASRWASAIPPGPAAMPTGRAIPAGLRYAPPKGPRGR